MWKSNRTWTTTHTHTEPTLIAADNLESPSNLTCMSLDNGRKLEYLREEADATLIPDTAYWKEHHGPLTRAIKPLFAVNLLRSVQWNHRTQQQDNNTTSGVIQKLATPLLGFPAITTVWQCWELKTDIKKLYTKALTGLAIKETNNQRCFWCGKVCGHG